MLLLIVMLFVILVQVWANIQSYDKLTRMDFDVSSSGQWQALFTKTESTTLSTSQQANLHYNPTDPAILSKLQDRLVFLYIHT